jgi:hypothetical protein
MAKKKDFYGVLDGFIQELYADGTAGGWKVDKKIKQAKELFRKATRMGKEQDIIDECLNKEKARKTA